MPRRGKKFIDGGTWRSPTTSPSTPAGATPFSATWTGRSCKA